MSDASDTAVGSILQQYIGDQWCPIAYFYKQLQPAQTRYNTFDKKLLAIYSLIKHFQNFIEGQQLLVYTNHKSLIHTLHESEEVYSEATSTRGLHFTIHLRYALSRVLKIDRQMHISPICVNALHVELNIIINFKEMAATQENNPELA